MNPTESATLRSAATKIADYWCKQASQQAAYLSSLGPDLRPKEPDLDYLEPADEQEWITLANQTASAAHYAAVAAGTTVVDPGTCWGCSLTTSDMAVMGGYVTITESGLCAECASRGPGHAPGVL